MANMLQGQNIEDENSHMYSVQQVSRYPRAGAVWVGGQHPGLDTSRLPTVETASEEPGTGLGVGGGSYCTLGGSDPSVQSRIMKGTRSVSRGLHAGPVRDVCMVCVCKVWTRSCHQDRVNTHPPSRAESSLRAAAPKGPRGEESWEQVHEDPSHIVGAAADSQLARLLLNPLTTAFSMLSRLRPAKLMNLL